MRNTAASILQQPGSYAWQVFDAQAKPLMRDEYKLRGATKVHGRHAGGAGHADAGRRSPRSSSKTVREYNAAITREVPFNPNVKDGRRTAGLEIDKSNWANALETAAVRGLLGRLRHHVHVRRREDRQRRRACSTSTDAPLPGLYAAGELVGGIFYFNYPGATGLMSSAVFGRLAGKSAAEYVKSLTAHLDVMPGLVPGIHAFLDAKQDMDAGTSPACRT